MKRPLAMHWRTAGASSARVALAWFALVSLVLASFVLGCGSDESPGRGAGGGGEAGSGGSMPPIELDWSCEPGTVPLGAGDCRDPGVPTDGCGLGFEHDDDAGCRPIIAEQPCPGGETALPGDATCRPVSPCLDDLDPWGGIRTGPNTTIYVDDDSSATMPDGTSAAPYAEIQDAVVAAPDGALIAVAAGDYLLPVLVEDKSLRIWGVCPSKVRLMPPLSSESALRLNDAGASVVRGLAVQNAQFGISVFETSFRGEELWVHDTLAQGIVLDNAMSLPPSRLRNVLVEDVNGAGLQITEGRLEAERVEVRGVRASMSFGYGIAAASLDPTLFERALTLRQVVVHDVLDIGIVALTSNLVVEDSYVHDVISSGPGVPALGRAGIYVNNVASPEVSRQATVHRSVVERALFAGVRTLDADLEMEGVVVRDVVAGEEVLGAGVLVQTTVDEEGPRPVWSLRDMLVERAEGAGIFTRGDGVVSGVVLRNAPPSADAPKSEGAYFLGSPTLDLEGVVVEGAMPYGLRVAGGVAHLRSVKVTGTRAFPEPGSLAGGLLLHPDELDLTLAGTAEANDLWIEDNDFLGVAVAQETVLRRARIVGSNRHPADDLFGDGVVAISFFVEAAPTVARIEESDVRNNDRAGLAAFGASVELTDTAIACNAFELNGEDHKGLEFALGGDGNVCGCDQDLTCKVLSTGLTPPPPPE